MKWLAELDGQIPTIVLEARDDHGGDLADVRVEVDSRPVQNYAAGRPFELDPGRHVLRVFFLELVRFGFFAHATEAFASPVN